MDAESVKKLGEQGAGSMFEDVRAFHAATGLVVRRRATLLEGDAMEARAISDWTDALRGKTFKVAVRAGNGDAFARRLRLIAEELHEVVEAHLAGDLAEFADGLADLAWVVLGTAVEAGIPFDEVWAEVRRANMAKAGGTLDASGKLQKPPGWRPPDVAAVLARQEAAGGCSCPCADCIAGACQRCEVC
jgi:predicted HAD superfamily Cof-like phosphohydrolase